MPERWFCWTSCLLASSKTATVFSFSRRWFACCASTVLSSQRLNDTDDLFPTATFSPTSVLFAVTSTSDSTVPSPQKPAASLSSISTRPTLRTSSSFSRPVLVVSASTSKPPTLSLSSTRTGTRRTICKPWLAPTESVRRTTSTSTASLRRTRWKRTSLSGRGRR
jgi:hypothetical protein